MLVFSKELTLKAIKDAGNEDKLTDEMIEDMNNYDGCEAVKSNWDALVKDEELYIVKGKNGKTIKVDRNLIKEV